MTLSTTVRALLGVVVVVMATVWYARQRTASVGNFSNTHQPPAVKSISPMESKIIRLLTNSSSINNRNTNSPKEFYRVFRVLRANDVDVNLGDSNEEVSLLGKKLRVYLNDRLPNIYSLLSQSEYDSRTKNPCWWTNKTFDYKFSRSYYSNHFRKTYASGGVTHQVDSVLRNLLLQKKSPTLLCLPFFLIVGMPKCGTTDLFRRIVSHPQVVEPAMKEPHWWSRRRHEARATFLDYLFLFSKAAKTIRVNLPESGQLVTGEGSASTLFDMGSDSISTVELVYSVLPHSKLIVILRDPTTRLFSEYLYFVCLRQSFTKCSSEDFHRRASRAVANFQACVSKSSVTHCLYNSSYGTGGIRVKLGLYYELLQPWLKLYPLGKQLLVVRLEEYSSHMTQKLKNTFDFLGLDPIQDDEVSRITALPFQNSVSRELKNRVGPMLSQTKDLLRVFYREHNERLANLLQDPGYLWITT